MLWFYMLLKKMDYFVIIFDKYSYCFRVGIFFDNKYFIFSGIKGKFLDDIGVIEFVGGKVFELGDNLVVGGNGDKLV